MTLSLREPRSKSKNLEKVDSIEGPIVKLKNGTVARAFDEEEALKIRDDVEEVLFGGDILIGFGEFLENNHPLLPSGYCEEWWIHEARKKGYKKDVTYLPTPDEALDLTGLGIPLHPRYTYFYHDLSKKELKSLAKWLCTGKIENDCLVVADGDEKRLLEVLGVPHKVVGEIILISEYSPLLNTLGIEDLQMGRFLDAAGVNNGNCK
jgi:DNA polymerase II large subunit